jgi:outer membrane protein assembly factor BamB/tetratricopeptide (TPR) repeat protein
MARLHRAPGLLLGAGLLAGLSFLAPAPAVEPPAAVPDAPVLERLWAQPTVREEQTRNWLDKQVIPYLEQRGEPVLPTTYPLAVNDRVLFRSHWGVHAVNLRTGKLEWESDSRWSVDRMVRDPGKTGAVTFWLNSYLAGNQPGVIFENALVGSLSSDGRRLFAVEDFQVAPFATQNGNPGMAAGYGPGLSEAVLHSRLQAFDLVTGKLIWELGARRDASDGPPADAPDDLAGSFFLAAPLVLDGKLYALNEKDANLRLLCLEPADGHLHFIQHVASFRTGLSIDPQRRMRAAALAYADGVLVCPTNAGFLLGIDLPTRTLLWAHDYRDPAATAAQPDNGDNPRLQILRLRGQVAPAAPPHHWKFAPPLLQDGKVVFTPPDGATLLCLGLRDGSRLWETQARQDDLYLAGIFGGRDRSSGPARVLLVGKKSCRALGLADGKPLWTVETGLPSGRGVAEGAVYFLPLKEAAHTGEPEVCAVDVEHGRVIAHTPSRKKEVPGNLLFHEGMVVSQTLGEVAVYPQVKVKLRQIDGLLDKDPHDPRALLERGELKLSEGDRPGAVTDLRAALETKPSAEVRDKAQAELFDALSELLQTDFAGGEKYLGEYETLSRWEGPEGAPAKDRLAAKRRRLGTYAFVLARGREQQGQLPAAVRAYLDFLAAGGDEPVTSPDDPAVKVSRAAWAGEHVAALIAKAPAAERRELEDALAGHGRTLQSGTDVEPLRRFARALGGTPAGRQARWTLAERLQKEKAFLEAELVLVQLRRETTEPAEAARALEALARLYADRGLFEDAVFCYRELGRAFPQTAVRDGQTGKDLFDAAASDPRLVPFLEEVNPTPPGRIKVEAGFGNFAQPTNLFTLEPEGDVLPFFRRHRLAIDLGSHRLRLIDRINGQERWGQDLPQSSFPNLVNTNGPQVPLRARFQVIGHLVVLNLGHLVFGLDPIDHRVLWEKSQFGSLEALGLANVGLDPEDGKPLVVYQDGWQQKVGQVGVVGAGAVCVQTRGGLVALDPYTGNLLWSRTDVAVRAHFLTDDQHLFAIEETEGKAIGTRAFRGLDGASVAVADCAPLFQRRLGVLGRDLLLTDTDTRGGYVLRLHDVLTGKDVWEKKFPAGSRAVRSEDPSLAAVVDPDGRVSILDAASGRRLTSVTMNPKDLNKGTQLRLLQDRAQFYIACYEPFNQQMFPNGPPVVNALPGSGLRGLPVNGKVYAFDRATGKEQWEAKATHQLLLVDQFAELPVLVLASRTQTVNNNNGNPVQKQTVAVRIISKRTGKLLYDEADLNNAQPFHALTRTGEPGVIELHSTNFRVALSLER